MKHALSEGWHEERFEKLTYNLDNKRIPLNSTQRKEKEGKGSYPYVGANNILCSIDEYIFDEKILCIAEDGGSWGHKQTCAFIMNEKCWVNNHAHVVTAKDNTILEYLKYYLNYADLSLHINGATRGKLNQSALKKIKIPLPPLAEQKKIAAILDAADKLRQKDQQLIAKYNALSQSLFLDMFGDPVINPMGWERRCFLDIFKTTTGKLDSNASSQAGRYPFFTCAKETLMIDSYSYDQEALLLAGNNAAGIFDVKYYKGKFDAYQRTYILCLKDTDADYSFMRIALEKKLEDLQRLSIGSSTKYLTMKILGRLEFTVPPITLQNQFAERIQHIEAQKQQAQAALQKSDDLFHGLLQRAFKGELTQ